MGDTNKLSMHHPVVERPLLAADSVTKTKINTIQATIIANSNNPAMFSIPCILIMANFNDFSTYSR